MPMMLNLGCGRRFHSSWTNVNFSPTASGVIEANLCLGIPFSDSTFDAVYHSHLLEHFKKQDGLELLKECYRVLKVGGVLRVAVPDLERLVDEYRAVLERARSGEANVEHDYEWILLEMYDQVARNVSGGEMGKYLSQRTVPNTDFVIKRCGAEASNLIKLGRKFNEESGGVKKKAFLNRLIENILSPVVYRERLLQWVLGKEYKALEIGRFRRSGENHQCMYDNYSLSNALKLVGFKDIVVRSAMDSYIEGWSRYNLDTEADGTVYKPDSLYIEALKR